MVTVTLLGLITYIVHGSLNNFLDTDKASVPFLGVIAMFAAIYTYHKAGIEPMQEMTQL